MPKKSKHIKITDFKKPWNIKKKARANEENTIEYNKTFLIVCEGQTEAKYSESFPVISAIVIALDIGGKSCFQSVEVAKNMRKDYDEVWCVFDYDINNKPKEKEDFDNAIKKGISSDVKIAYSNDVFELWYYLHFEYTDSCNHRTFYYEKLSQLFNLNYVREGKRLENCTKWYRFLEQNENASQEKAIKNAEKLYGKNKTLAFHKQNPVTLVYQLVEELNKYKRK